LFWIKWAESEYDLDNGGFHDSRDHEEFDQAVDPDGDNIPADVWRNVRTVLNLCFFHFFHAVFLKHQRKKTVVREVEIPWYTIVVTGFPAKTCNSIKIFRAQKNLKKGSSGKERK